MLIIWLLLTTTSSILLCAFTPSPTINTRRCFSSISSLSLKDILSSVQRDYKTMNESMDKSTPVIAVLTLERHQNGIWISKLMEALSDLCQQEIEYHGNMVKIRPIIYTLESFQMSDFAEVSMTTKWLCFVNRVSDAASPKEVKACQAILTAARIWNIPTYNGAKCYAIGSNKMLHHHVFVRAGLQIPRSTIVVFHDNETIESYRRKLLSAIETLTKTHKINFPLLVKPNSGGFGKGIRIIYSMDQVPSVIDSLCNDTEYAASDRVMLIQEFIEPFQDKVYRVWFLDGKVQCAVERPFSSDLVLNQMPEVVIDTKAFTGGCAGENNGSCSLDYDESLEESPSTESAVIATSTTIKPEKWIVPQNIISEIENLLTHVGDDCYAGSVEFLFQNDTEHPVYFDLNILSTLPLDIDSEWMKLAQSILRVALN